MAEKKLIEANEFLGMDDHLVWGIGDLTDKQGYKRANINLTILEAAIKELRRFGLEAVDIFVNSDKPVQIGKRDIGAIIAPRVPKDDDRYKLADAEKYRE